MIDTRVSQHRVLRLKEVSRRVGLARSTIYDRINPKSPRYDDDFPKPIKIGATAVGWLESRINGWIEMKSKNQ